MLRAVRSRPEPNGETEAKVREQLKRLDVLLDIRWFPYAVYNEHYHDFEGRYALVCQWPSNDGRWELYQKGEIEDNVDMFGWFCTDMHDANSTPVSPDSIENKVLELLHNCDDQRMPHAKRMANIVQKNAKVRRDRKQEILDQAGDMAGSLHNLAGKVDDTTLERIMKEITKEGK